MNSPGFLRPLEEIALSSLRPSRFRAALARENLQRMWWLLLTSTCLSILLTFYNIFVAGQRSLYPWNAFDLCGSAIFLVLFWRARAGRFPDRFIWWLGPSYFGFWLTLMLGYYATGLQAYGETSTFLIGAITPSVLIFLPTRLVAGMLLTYYLAFCGVLMSPLSEWRGQNGVAASFLNGSLGVVVAFLAAWFLYRARIRNFESEELIKEQAEKARFGEQTVRAILENMPFRAWLKGVDGKFLVVNQAFATSLLKAPDEIVSKTVEELFDPATAREYLEQDRQVIEQKQPVDLERVVGEGPGRRWLEVHKYPIFAKDGSIAALAGLSIDVTEKKQLAESLIATDRAKSEFLAMMSHEVRTPMNSILGYADLLRDESNGENAQEYVQCIQESGQLLLAIINDILDLSKIEAGKLDLHPTSFEIADLVDRIRRRFSPQAEQKGVRLRTEISAGTIAVATADSRRLEQVLGNLVSNAVKFTAKGSVTLSVSSEIALGGGVILRCVVRDTGIGISKEELERLFRPFSQVDSSIGRKYGGSGLGLVIARTLCLRMGGDLVVESREQIGSTFTATVEVLKPEEATSGAGAASRDLSQLDGRRVLVVEDNRINRRLIATILQKWGSEVTLAEDGSQALEIVAHAEFDAVLMDVQMPGLDGFETTRRIRTLEKLHPQRKRTRIIAVTAFAMVGDEQKCFDAGMDDYVGKPIHTADLIRALSRES